MSKKSCPRDKMKSMESIFQSKEWEEFKLATGYAKSYWVEDILVLQKELPLGRTMLYSPMVSGEAATSIMGNELSIKGFIDQIRGIAARENSIFFRLELDLPHDTRPMILNTEFGFAKSFEEMQPEHTLILDLTKSEGEILAQMKQKGRYNIKIADKNGIRIEKENSIENFYHLYSETGRRHHISFRGKEYFVNLLDILTRSDYIAVYTAFLGNLPVASAIVVYSGSQAIYMFGASSDEHKNLMAPYLLHWQIIQESKQKGCEAYDFFGIAPDDNPRHPWAGVTRFKKQFGGEQYDILGSFDLPFRPLEYTLFKIAEKIRRH